MKIQLYMVVLTILLFLDDFYIPPPPPPMSAVPPPPPPPQMDLPKVNKPVDTSLDPRSALLDAIRSGKTLKVCKHLFKH